MADNGFYDADAIERVRARISGRGYDAAVEAAARLAAVEEAYRRHPYFLTGRLALFPDAGSGAGVLPANAPANLLIPKQGVPRDTAVYGAITDAHLGTALFNIVRRRNLPVGIYEQSMISSPQRALVLAGDMNAEANRIGRADFLWWPQPEILEKGEPLNLLGQGDGATANVSKCYYVLYGEQEYDVELNAEDKASVLQQINSNEQVTVARVLNIDFSNPATYTEIELPPVDRWSLLMGFASGSASAGSQYPRWCTVSVEDERGRYWSNEPIPIGALASFPFDTENTQVFYRKLLTPYLLRPGENRRIKLTFTPRDATLIGDYPPSVAADTLGRFVAMIKSA